MKAKTFLVSALLCVSAVFSGAYAQESTEILKNAVQFQIGSDFSLKNFDGYTFSYKYRLGTSSAFRAGFGISGNSGSSNEKASNLLNVNGADTDYSRYDIRIGMQYLKTLSSVNNVQFYLGAGPQIRYISEKTTNKSAYNSPESRTEENLKTFIGGADILAGVECFVTKNISLSGEYGMQLSYVWTKNTTSSKFSTANESNHETKSNSYRIEPGNARLGVSVYF